MPLQTEEQNEKKPSLFIKLDNKNIVILKSNVYIVKSHFIKSMNRTVACYGDECKIDHAENLPRKEYYYFASVNETDGVVRLPATVFFDMNAIEAATKKDKRLVSWLIIKSGSGLDTKYTTTKDEALDKMDLDYDKDKNNSNLSQVMGRYEESIGEKYQEFETGEGEEEENE